MNKAELIDEFAREASVSKAEATQLLESFCNQIARGLKDSGKVALVGFGTFSVADRPARTGRNPQTGEPMDIPARRVVRFVPGKALKDSVN